jgi:hypothetical protein
VLLWLVTTYVWIFIGPVDSKRPQHYASQSIRCSRASPSGWPRSGPRDLLTQLARSLNNHAALCDAYPALGAARSVWQRDHIV